ncbi:hypothetical protein AX13_03615 [Comamonas aquatica DA1877]|uniref:Uncharacterized protein n=1 Tax=Comamonas aquatica DA1877 TaxID=1457173 RepID=A0A014MNU2_9BURK|nr:hypothetical protein AX13_03615 [Comamonas aquatica DA1877]
MSTFLLPMAEFVPMRLLCSKQDVSTACPL